MIYGSNVHQSVYIYMYAICPVLFYNYKLSLYCNSHNIGGGGGVCNFENKKKVWVLRQRN
jgi:hypothetical protein